MTTVERTSSPPCAVPSVLRLEAVTLAVWAGLSTIVIVGCLAACGGRFFYTLDDAYIHLSVGWHILQGGYGVNASEYSSPSSSILWPYLVALTEALGFGTLGPLAISLAAAATTLIVALGMLRREGVFASSPPWFAFALGCFVIFVISGVALPMTGMEHSLHILLAVIALDQLLRFAAGGGSRAAIVGAIVLMPLVRFEGLAFSGAAIVALWLLGARRAAGASMLGLAAISAIYVVVATKRGLPLLPSSVLLKSAAASAAYGHRNPLGQVFANLKNLTGPGLPLLGLGVVLVIAAFLDRARPRHLIVWCAVIVAVLGHMLIGGYGWFYRYEVYVKALAALACVIALRGGSRQWNAARSVAVTLAFAALAYPYIQAAYLTPAASRNVYDQQYQMARFAQDVYDGPVAVNDLGLVSYKNAQFVLDLWGLGSEAVRKWRRDGVYTAARMESLARDDHVGLVMIYGSWFASGEPENGKLDVGIPTTWKRIAVLDTPAVSSGDRKVSFFATPQADVGKVRAELETFAPSLPAEDHMIFDEK